MYRNFIAFYSSCIFTVWCWDLSSIFLDTAVLTNVNVIRNRAILCVPRISENQTATLLEAGWPERGSLKKGVTVYPRNIEQTLDNCDNVQSAVSSDDDAKGRLFVLDRGFNDCEPKVIVYDMRSNKKVSDSTLSNVPPSRLHTIVVDTASPYGTRAYIADSGDGFLIVYNANDRHWWRVYLEPPGGGKVNYVPMHDMVVSYSKAEPKLYLTSYETDKLFSLSLAELRKFESPPPVLSDSTAYNATTLATVMEGSKLGRSVGLTVDQRNGVYYYLPQDYACVRWDTRQPMRAESHDVVLQSASQLPKVYQLFTDAQNQIWAQLGTQRENEDHCLLLRKPNYLPVLYP